MPQLLKPMRPRAHALEQERPLKGAARALQLESNPRSPQLEKGPRSNEDSAKNK